MRYYINPRSGIFISRVGNTLHMNFTVRVPRCLNPLIVLFSHKKHFEKHGWWPINPRDEFGYRMWRPFDAKER